MDVHAREKLPEDLARGVMQFKRWRRWRPARTRIPVELWQLALELADRHGINRTAVALRIGYYCLKKRLSQSSAGESARPSSGGVKLALSRRSQPEFVELPPVVGTTGSGECWLEFEKPSGARLRVSLKGQSLANLCQLGRDFWEVG